MGENSAIPWTQHTYNPWQGCYPRSEGCANCYMYRDKKRYGQDPTVVVRSTPATFNKPLTWHEPAMVFTCSWSDFFIEEADPWRDEAWDIIKRTPHLIYQILTKRPERIVGHLPKGWGYGFSEYKNVWLGITAENQKRLEERWYDLRQVRATNLFISYEPALGPLDISGCKGLSWLIAGCESGPHARPMHADWLPSIIQQCKWANIPLFIKQARIDGKLVKMPVIDGKVWNEYPNQEVA